MEIRRAVARPARGNGRVATSRRVAMARAGLQCPKGRRRESPELEVWWGENQLLGFLEVPCENFILVYLFLLLSVKWQILINHHFHNNLMYIMYIDMLKF